MHGIPGDVPQVSGVGVTESQKPQPELYRARSAVLLFYG